MKCLWCDNELNQIIDLGNQPLANSLLKSKDESELIYPLIFAQCPHCKLAQTVRFDYKPFGNEYPYFSGVGTSYVKQCADLARRLLKQLEPKTVIEIGSNDGYMLEHFKNLKHIGYEPSFGPHSKALEKGVNSVNEYFSENEWKAELIMAFNVVAHTPYLRSMIQSIKKSLAPRGVVVVEIQDLAELLKHDYFDCIYHEHYSYFEINSLAALFREEGLELTSWEPIPSHGGSLRAFFSHTSYKEFEPIKWNNFDHLEGRVKYFKHEFRQFIYKTQMSFQDICLFGAPAKGNTFLNYCGIKSDEIRFAVDETPAKIGKFLPGSRIPILDIRTLNHKSIDYCVIMPWNFEAEIRQKILSINPSIKAVTPYRLS